MLRQSWQISLFESLEARQGPAVISKFSTRHTALLFAYLAHSVGKYAARDALVEMLWPESDIEIGRSRLRVALASIRRQIEPPGTRPGSILVADRASVRLSDDACTVDSVEFRKLVEGALSQSSAQRASEQLVQANDLYRGTFCEGLDADWVLDERYALTHLQVTGQMRLSQILARSGDVERALKHARRAAVADPLSEPARRVLIRFLLATRQADAAASELEEFKRVLRRETGLSPSPETLRLLDAPVSYIEEQIGRADAVEQTSETVSPVKGVSDRLPRFLDTYVGQLDELSSLEALLGVSRVVSLTGPGGVGKTRLAVELIHAAFSSFGAGIWFVVVPPDQPRLLLDLILEAVDPMKSGVEDALTFVSHMLEGGAEGTARNASLLIIDGAEHLSESGPKEILGLLRTAPNLTILVTSRRRLGIVGEQEYQVKPLDMPDLDDPTCLEELAGNPSVRLFVERARAIQPDFQPNTANATSLAQICVSLDGIPLAIELAAARIRKTPLRSIVQELAQLKTDEEPNSWRPAGHRSLEAALSWSYESLSETDQRCLSRLAVFGSTWDLYAAEAVLVVRDAQKILERLAENSLIIKKEVLSQHRYHMLPSVRNFAFRKLSADEAEEAARLHATHFLHRSLRFSASALHVGVFGNITPIQERENFRASLIWHSSKPDMAQEFYSLVAALTWFWVFGGGISEGRRWVEQARASLGQATGPTVALLLLSEGILACYRDDAQSAVAHLEIAIQLLEAGNDPRILAQARWAMGFAQYVTGNYPQAREYLLVALDRLSQADAPWWVGATHNLLGFVACAEGKDEAAEAHFSFSQESWQTAGDRLVMDYSDLGLARVSWRRGNLERSETIYKTCLEQFQIRGDHRGMTYSVEGLARVCASSGRSSLAARLLGAAQRLREAHGLQMDCADSALHAETQQAALKKLGGRFDAEWNVGHSLSPEAVCRYAANSG